MPVRFVAACLWGGTRRMRLVPLFVAPAAPVPRGASISWHLRPHPQLPVPTTLAPALRDACNSQCPLLPSRVALASRGAFGSRGLRFVTPPAPSARSLRRSRLGAPTVPPPAAGGARNLRRLAGEPSTTRCHGNSLAYPLIKANEFPWHMVSGRDSQRPLPEGLVSGMPCRAGTPCNVARPWGMRHRERLAVG